MARLVYLLIAVAVVIGIVVALRATRDVSERVATVPGALVNEAGAQAAASNVRAAIPALEAFRVENATYAGATIAELRRYNPAIDASVTIVSVGDAGYCLQSTVAGETASVRSPSAQVTPGGC